MESGRILHDRRVSESYIQGVRMLHSNEGVRKSVHVSGVGRVSGSHVYSTAWDRMYILTPYTPAYTRRIRRLLTGRPLMCLVYVGRQLMCLVYVGCQKVMCILLQGIVCIFSHPTHKYTPDESGVR